MTSKLTSNERLAKILSETQATIMEHNSRCVRGSVEVDALLFESMIMELQERRKAEKNREPVAWGLFDFSNGALYNFCSSESSAEQYQNQIHQSSDYLTLEIGALYRHAQQTVVPEEKPMPNPLSMYAVDAVAAIAEVRGWNACRAAMLNGGK